MNELPCFQSGNVTNTQQLKYKIALAIQPDLVKHSYLARLIKLSVWSSQPDLAKWLKVLCLVLQEGIKLKVHLIENFEV